MKATKKKKMKNLTKQKLSFFFVIKFENVCSLHYRCSDGFSNGLGYA